MIHSGELIRRVTEARSYLSPNAIATRIVTLLGYFRSECFAGVEHKSTHANYSLGICDIKIRSTFHIQYELGLTLH